MCQAYDAEYRQICREEADAACDGYDAARAGRPNVNPCGEWDVYRRRAWQHGYDCFRQHIKPYAVERRDNREIANCVHVRA